MDLVFYQCISSQILGAVQAALLLRNALVSGHGIPAELLGTGWTFAGRREILVLSGAGGGIFHRGHPGQGTTRGADDRVLVVGQSLKGLETETTSCPWC